MVKEILKNEKGECYWEIVVHTYNIYNDYFKTYERDMDGNVFENHWSMDLKKTKGKVN